MKNLYKYAFMALSVAFVYTCAEAKGGIKELINDTDLTFTSGEFSKPAAFIEQIPSGLEVPFGESLLPHRKKLIFIPEFDQPLVFVANTIDGKRLFIESLEVHETSKMVLQQQSPSEFRLIVLSRPEFKNEVYTGTIRATIKD